MFKLEESEMKKKVALKGSALLPLLQHDRAENIVPSLPIDGRTRIGFRPSQHLCFISHVDPNDLPFFSGPGCF